MSLIIFAIFLYLLCALLIVAEIFVPSGGLISLCAFLCLVLGVILFFKFNFVAGWVGIIIAIVMIPSITILMYKLLLKTTFGKNVTLSPPKRIPGDAIQNQEQLDGLLGKKGVVLTPLRPIGICDIEGMRVQCSSESGMVEKGGSVEVILVEGTKIIVRVI